METGHAKPDSIDEYIAGFPPEKRAVLGRIRQTIRAAAPDAEEAISYRMPTFKQNGILVHFAAFTNHIGLYPPIQWRRRPGEGHRALCGGEGQSAIPARSADPLRPDREDRETPGEEEPGESVEAEEGMKPGSRFFVLSIPG